MAKKTEEISGSLLARIVRGDFRESGRLPRELDLGEEYGVARHTVRAARDILAGHGVVKVTHGVPGAAITPADEWDLFSADLLESLFGSESGRELLGEALETRQLIDPPAAGMAAERATGADLEALRDAMAAVRAASDPTAPKLPGMRAASTPETDFHRAVLHAAHNRFVARALLPLELVLATAARGRGAEAAADQEAILAAIERRDPAKARAAMRRRLQHLAGALGDAAGATG